MKETYRTTGRAVSFHFVTSNRDAGEGFRLLITAVREGNVIVVLN